DFDFTRTNGFILRVSAGIDLVQKEATWLLQAIDPLTGEIIQDPTKGLLPPNDARGQGAGFVTYTILPAATAVTGAQVSAPARLTPHPRPPARPRDAHPHHPRPRADAAVARPPPVADRRQLPVAMAGGRRRQRLGRRARDAVRGDRRRHVQDLAVAGARRV